MRSGYDDMKNPIRITIAIFSLFVLLSSCKKQKEEEVREDAKVKTYSQLGYDYLLSCDNAGADSVMPVFVAKSTEGVCKMILRYFVNGQGSNKSSQSTSGIVENWPVNIPNLNTIGRMVECRLNDNGDLAVDDLSFVPNDERYKNGKIIAAGDMIAYTAPGKTYTWPSDGAKALRKVKRTRGNSVAEYDNCYRASLFKHGDRTYFLYNEPDDLNAYTFKSHLYFQAEENGAVIKKERVTGDVMTTLRGGCDGQHVDGLEFYPIVGKKGNFPVYAMLRSQYSENNYNRMSLFFPGNSNSLITVYLDGINHAYMQFFLYKSELFLSTFNAEKLYDECSLYKLVGSKFVKQEIKLTGIKGIFGCENGIVAAVKSAEKGLDIVQIFK